MQQDKRQGYQPQLAPGHQPGVQPGGKTAVLGSTVQLYDACNAAWQIGQGKDGDGCHAQWLVEHLQEDLQHMQQDCTGCICLEPWGRSATHATSLYRAHLFGALGKICNTCNKTIQWSIRNLGEDLQHKTGNKTGQWSIWSLEENLQHKTINKTVQCLLGALGNICNTCNKTVLWSIGSLREDLHLKTCNKTVNRCFTKNDWVFLSLAVRTCCCISTVLLVYDLNSILYLQPQHTSTVLPQYFYCIVTVPLLCCCCTSPLYFCCTCTVHPLCCHCTCTVHPLCCHCTCTVHSLCCCNTCTVHLLCCHCTCSVHLPCYHCTSTTLHCTVPNVQVRKTYLVPSVSSTVDEVDVDTVQSPQVEHTKR